MAVYEDFWISVNGRTEDSPGFNVRVRSPAGEGAGTLVLPLEVGETGRVLEEIDRSMRGARDGPTRDVMGLTSPAPMDDLGTRLYQSLFTGAVRSRFDESRPRPNDVAQKLRIRLEIDLDQPGGIEVAALPWELLFDHERREALALSERTSVTRYLSVERPQTPRPFEPPLRILFVAANPYRDLDLATERNDIVEQLSREEGRCQITFIEDATFEQFAERLVVEDPHVIHFMGHGGFEGDVGTLRFQDGPVPGPVLAERLINERQTSLVVLNACRTAEVTRRRGRDPFAGVAAALVKAGVPAVVAMQFPITDGAAKHFSARFYGQLAQGRPVEEALQAGRLRIHAVTRGSTEWATPVLLLRGDGDLFRMPASSAGAADRGRAAAELHDDSLLPYMVDRRDLLFVLDEAFQQQKARPGSAVFAVVHGSDAECQDMLDRRLREVELPRRLRLNSMPPRYQIEWPKDVSDRDTFHRRLTWSLADSALHGADLRELREYMAALPVPPMICCSIHASDWKRYGEAALDHYLSWWQEFAGSPPAMRAISFLFAKYEEPATGWLRRLQTSGANGQIERSLERLETLTPDSLVVRVLPALGSIGQEDVVRWNADHGRPLSEEEILGLFETWTRETKQKEMSMRELARRLRALLDADPVTMEGSR